MAKSLFSQVIIVILAFIWQQAIAPILPLGLSFLNAVALLAVFGLFLWPAKKVLASLFFLGLLMDLYSFFYFGTYIFLLSFIYIFVKVFLDKILTNRSLYALSALVAMVVVIWQTFFWLLFYWQSWAGRVFLLLLAKSLVVNLLSATILFYLIHYLSRRLAPVFIFQKK